jgi:hypothetical protein
MRFFKKKPPASLCPECRAEGETCDVYPGILSTTCMSGTNETYYDEYHRLHCHPVNRMTQQWSCSRGHRWVEGVRWKCPNGECGWEQA